MCGIFAIIGQYDNVQNNYKLLRHRGPDVSNTKSIHNVFLGFHRLKIMDTSDAANQPFDILDTLLICNGEIYNYIDLKQKYNIQTTTANDCEVIPHLYRKIGIKNTIKQLDGVFSFFLYDKKYKQFYVARDYIGVRPLFIGHHKNYIAFSSELKAIDNICYKCKPFPPGHCMIHYEIQPYFDWNIQKNVDEIHSSHSKLIRYFLENSVKKRMMSNRPIGCFLSGGLDSSIICSLVKKYSTTSFHTFSIGMEGSDDLVYARKVADFLKTHHHELTFTCMDGFYILDELIKQIETYDVTTIRASIPQYLLSRYISENTDVRVVFSGEGADEHFAGYRYLQYAKDKNTLDSELFSLLKNVHQFDVLRSDRTTAAFGLEVRVPFLDKHLVKYSMSIPTHLKLPSTQNMEKFILRQAFDNIDAPYLPPDVLWRRKDAFSDSVGSEWRNGLIDKINDLITTQEFNNHPYTHNPPQTKEALYYRRIFEKYYPNREKIITKPWMPNKEWFKEPISDPSAKVLPNLV